MNARYSTINNPLKGLANRHNKYKSHGMAHKDNNDLVLSFVTSTLKSSVC